MFESSPEAQLGLPIFPEETAWYTIGGPSLYGAEHNTPTETVHVPVDEIDLMTDPRMREALWRQFKIRTSQKPKSVLFVIANPDKTYYGTNSARLGAPTRYIAESGTSDNEQNATDALPELVIEKQTAARRIIERIFGQ